VEKKNTIYILIAIACRLKISKSLLRANDPLIYIGDRREDTVRANSRICPHADKYGRGIVDDQPVRGAPGLFARTDAKIRRRSHKLPREGRNLCYLRSHIYASGPTKIRRRSHPSRVCVPDGTQTREGCARNTPPPVGGRVAIANSDSALPSRVLPSFPPPYGGSRSFTPPAGGRGTITTQALRVYSRVRVSRIN
jgi:hypothetical protein